MTGPETARLRQALRAPRFWLVQAGVLVLSGFHDLLLEHLDESGPAHGVPATLTSSLLLVPVTYAALAFGSGGALLTAAWATALVLPHWLLFGHHALSEVHLWIEVTTLLVVLGVGVVVGGRVDREQQSRLRAELSEARFRALFDGHASPVLVAGPDGVVADLNASARELLGPEAVGRTVAASLGAGLEQLRAGDPPYLTCPTPQGPRLYTASTTDVASSPALVQVVLTDVTEQHRRQEEQRAFSGRLITAVEEERRRLARDLHDEPLQYLVYVARALDDVAQLSDLPPELAGELARDAALSRAAADGLRTLIRGLRPPVLDDLGLVPAVRQLVEQAGGRAAVEVRLTVTGEEVRLPAEVELTAYRVVQESLSNVLRHSSARTADVALHVGEELLVTVGDDGRGFDVSATTSAHGRDGMGLLGMAERVAAVHGVLDVSSSPTGTRVSATIPLSP